MNPPQIVARLWLISRVLKKLILTIFACVLITFMEERIFRGPYSAISVNVTSSIDYAASGFVNRKSDVNLILVNLGYFVFRYYEISS